MLILGSFDLEVTSRPYAAGAPAGNPGGPHKSFGTTSMFSRDIAHPVSRRLDAEARRALRQPVEIAPS
jgi:hypothetical protein